MRTVIIYDNISPFGIANRPTLQYNFNINIIFWIA